MRRRYSFIILLISILIGGSLRAQETQTTDSLPSVVRRHLNAQFLSLNAQGGIVLRTNDYIREGKAVPVYSSFALKYGIYSSKDNWEDVAYGMPYFGIGFYGARFYNKKALGHPFSLFLFQGAEVRRFNRNLSLNYEIDLGMSFNWKPYDAFDNPRNVALGSSSNIHVGASMYFKSRLSKHFDLNYGLGLSHFSNGAQQLPNKGLNLFAPFVELVYNFQENPTYTETSSSHTPLPLEDRMDYDLTFTSTTRQVWVDTVGTGLPSRVLDKNFKVFGLSYSALFVHNYKYKWGPSMELVYDESSGMRAWRQEHPTDGYFYDRVKLGTFFERLSLGLSIRGEVSYPRHSFFAHLGYNILHGNSYDYRFYQIVGLKAYLQGNFFGTFGIRASRFSKAQYLYWSIGYTIPGKPFVRKKRLNPL